MVRWAGVAVGATLAALALLSWRIPHSGGALGADVQFVATPSGELATSPSGAFLSARRLLPGGRPGTGDLRVDNVAGRPLAVRLRLLPSDPGLDRELRVELRGGDRTIEAPLARLRSLTASVLHLRPRQTRRLRVRAWVPRSAGPGYEGRIAEVTVDLRAVPERWSR
jgi:hypothetical protein